MRAPRLHLHLAFFGALLRLRAASAVLVNVTVDDTFGDPLTGAQFEYGPEDAWSAGQNCSDCLAHPDAYDAFLGSWHDGTFLPTSLGGTGVPLTASVEFNGSALYVFCIVPQSAMDFDGNMLVSFLIDDEPLGKFVNYPPSMSDAFDYSVPVYANDSIVPGLHTFTLVNGYADASTQSLALLDYIVYTRDDGTNDTKDSASQTSSSPSAPSTSGPTVSASVFGSPTAHTSTSTLSPHVRMVAILVSTIGGAFFIALLAALVLFLRRRHAYAVCARDDADRAPPPPPIDEDPALSGWAVGTWARDSSVASVHSQRAWPWQRFFGGRTAAESAGTGSGSGRGEHEVELPAARGTTEGGSFILPLRRTAAYSSPAVSASLMLSVQPSMYPVQSTPGAGPSKPKPRARSLDARPPQLERILRHSPLRLHIPTAGGSIFIESELLSPQSEAVICARAHPPEGVAHTDSSNNAVHSPGDVARSPLGTVHSLVDTVQSPQTVYLPARADSVKTILSLAGARQKPPQPAVPPLPPLLEGWVGGINMEAAVVRRRERVREDRETTEKMRCRRMARFFTIGAECHKGGAT